MQDTPFKIYNASAGSGKTFSLVRDYLTLLFQAKKPDAFRHILAITFTNKAVAEMKSRIVKSLIAFSEDPIPKDDEAMLNAVAEKTGLSTEIIQQKSHHILKHLIHNYAAFEVSTIDGFTHRVLRTFAKDLNLPSNFEVTMQVDDVLHEAVDRLISKAGEDKLLTRTLVNFALSKADDDKSWDITRELYDIARLLSVETNLEHLKALEDKSLTDFEAFSKKLSKHLTSIKDKIVTIVDAVFQLIESNGISPEHAFTGKYAYKYFLKLKTKELDGLKFEAAWQKNLSDNSKPLYAKTSKELSTEQKTTLDTLQPEIAAYFEDSKTAILQLDFIERIFKNLIPLSLLNTIKAEVEAIKKERNLLLISEFNNTIAEAIGGQPAPFIYERLGERYRHFFVDEFQDTSELQWENLIPLAENPLSSLDEQGNQGSLLLVGDAKQSIYRWRGGKAEQFIDLYNNNNPFPGIEKNVLNLEENYRSLPEVVNFNNALFKHLASHFEMDSYANLYSKSHQNPTKKDVGYVSLKFYDVNNKEEENETFPKEVLKTIRECEGLGYSKKDICIITRKRKEGVEIANYLSGEGVPVISSETLLVQNSPEVLFVIDILQLVEHPNDNLTKVEILHYLIDSGKINEEPTAFIIKCLAYSPAEFYEQLSAYNITFNPHYLNNLALYDALDYIVNAFHLIDTSNAYVQYFLDFAFDYASLNIGGISGFLDHWEQHKKKLSIVVPEGEDAVQLITIHRSKGLEFPIVIFPYAVEDIMNTKMDSLWVDLPEPLNDIPKAYISASSSLETLDVSVAEPYLNLMHEKQLDGINILYVVLTRAKEQLYILGKHDVDAKGNPKTKTVSGLLIDFLQKQSLWDNSKMEYQFGSPHDKVSKGDDSQIASIVQKKVDTSSFEERSITLSTNSGRLWGTSVQQAKDDGILIHDIMAEINVHDDVEAVLEHFLNSGRISAERFEEVSAKIKAIVTHAELKDYFSADAINYNERDMISEAQEILRPDRINILPNNTAVLIDYKTGVFNERNEDQIIEYSDTLKQMGYDVIKRLLVYTNETLDIKNV